MSKRIQLRRTKGWRKPEGAVVVARPTKWGNPFPVGGPSSTFSRQDAVDAYRRWLAHADHTELREQGRAELTGKDLACWCPLGQPCHADVLLEIANNIGGGE